MEAISAMQVRWHKERQKGIGGSDVAAIMGLSKWKTPLQVYNEKIAEEPIISPDTPKTRAGKMLEAAIAQWWAEEHEFIVQQDSIIRVHPEKEHYIANIDRKIIDCQRGDGVLEIKNTSYFAYKTWEEEGVSLDHYSQVQHYLNVTGYKWGAIAVLVDGWNLMSIDVPVDLDYIQLIEARLDEFWFEHVLKHVPPEPVSEEDLKVLYPKSSDSVIVEASPEIFTIYENAISAKATLKQAKEYYDSLEFQLKTVMRDAPEMAFEGRRLATWKSTKPSKKFDDKSFALAHPRLAKKFYESQPGSRRFCLK